MSDSDRIDRTHIMDSRVPPRQPFVRMSSAERLTTQGEPNGRPLPKPYVWRGNEQARIEADAAFIADTRRRARERFEAGLPPEFDVTFSSAEPPPTRPAWCTACRHHYRASNPQCACACHLDLPAGAGETPPVTTAPCPAAPSASAALTTADKGDSWPAEVPGPVPAVTGTGDAGPGTTGRCDFCGYMRGSRGHEITCGEA